MEVVFWIYLVCFSQLQWWLDPSDAIVEPFSTLKLTWRVGRCMFGRTSYQDGTVGSHPAFLLVIGTVMFIDRRFYNWLRLLVYECLSILSLSNRPTVPGKADLELCKNHRISQPAVLEEPWRSAQRQQAAQCSMKRHSRYHSGLTELRLQTVHDDILYIYIYTYM